MSYSDYTYTLETSDLKDDEEPTIIEESRTVREVNSIQSNSIQFLPGLPPLPQYHRYALVNGIV